MNHRITEEFEVVFVGRGVRDLDFGIIANQRDIAQTLLGFLIREIRSILHHRLVVRIKQRMDGFQIDLLPVGLLPLIREHRRQDLVGIRARNKLIFIDIPQEMHRTVRVGKFQLDPELVQSHGGGTLIQRIIGDLGNGDLGDYGKSRYRILHDFGFPDVLDALAVTADHQIQLVRIQIRLPVDGTIVPVDPAGAGGNPDIRHGERDRHGLPFQGRVHTGKILLQAGRACY